VIFCDCIELPAAATAVLWLMAACLSMHLLIFAHHLIERFRGKS
jgi:hypothetical protein